MSPNYSFQLTQRQKRFLHKILFFLLTAAVYPSSHSSTSLTTFFSFPNMWKHTAVLIHSFISQLKLRQTSSHIIDRHVENGCQWLRSTQSFTESIAFLYVVVHHICTAFAFTLYFFEKRMMTKKKQTNRFIRKTTFSSVKSCEQHMVAIPIQLCHCRLQNREAPFFLSPSVQPLASHSLLP